MSVKRRDHHTTTSLRPEEAKPSRAEIDVLRQKIADLIAHKPEKAAAILAEWVNALVGTAKNSTRKKAG